MKKCIIKNILTFICLRRTLFFKVAHHTVTLTSRASVTLTRMRVNLTSRASVTLTRMRAQYVVGRNVYISHCFDIYMS
jgi:hypothetical protein